MTDRLGWRARIGLLVPAFNTTTQPELESMRPAGVTNHVARIDMPDGELRSDADQEEVIRSVGDDLHGALKRVMLARPAAVIVGISIPAFWGGAQGSLRLKGDLEAIARVPIILGSEACVAALRCWSAARRIAVMTPYQPVGDAKVQMFFEQHGYEVAAMHSLLRPRGSAIAESDETMLRGGLDILAASKPDIIVQVGTNLAVADLVEQESDRLGLPVISINTATYWLALRGIGITDQRHGFGPLLAEL